MQRNLMKWNTHAHALFCWSRMNQIVWEFVLFGILDCVHFGGRKQVDLVVFGRSFLRITHNAKMTNKPDIYWHWTNLMWCGIKSHFTRKLRCIIKWRTQFIASPEICNWITVVFAMNANAVSFPPVLLFSILLFFSSRNVISINIIALNMYKSNASYFAAVVATSAVAVVAMRPNNVQNAWLHESFNRTSMRFSFHLTLAKNPCIFLVTSI